MSSIKKENLTLTLAISAILSTQVGCKPIMIQPVNPSTQGTPTPVPQPQNQQTLQSNAFFNSQYTYNDAALLADFWGKATPWDAKLKIGDLLLNRNDRAVQLALQSAKQNQIPTTPAISQQDQQINAFGSKYSYNDAALLADFWKTASVWDAKLKMGALMLRGSDSIVQKALVDANNRNVLPNQEQQQVNAYASKYTYNDADLLAKFWGTTTVWDAKVRIGSLMLRGDDAAVQRDLNNARNTNNSALRDQQMFDAYVNNYNYSDAVLLARFWGKASVWDAKLKIGNLLLNGNHAAVEQALRSAQGI